MPPGALVSVIQKGVQYVEAEVALSEVMYHHFVGGCQTNSCINKIFKIAETD